MNRGVRIVSILLGAGILLLAGSYLFARPTWKTASEAEVRAQLDRELLDFPADIPDARARYDRLTAILDRIPLTGVIEVTVGKTSTAVHTKGAPHLKAMEALLREGPIQSPASEAKDSAVGKSLQLVREMTQAAPQEVREGRPESAARLLRLVVLLHNRLMENARTTSDFQFGAARVGLLLRGLEDSLLGLRGDSLARLAAEMPPPRTDDPALLNSIRDDVRTYYIPMVADPVGWSVRDNPERPGQLLGMVLQEDSETIRLRGNFDALETARDLNRALKPWRLNTSRLRDEEDRSGDAFLRSLDRSLPVSTAAGKQGIARQIADWRFSWEMARLPNSFGRRLLANFSNGAFQAFADTSFRTRVCWEGMRTTIALRRYRLAKETSAPSLQALVDSGFLKKLPFDFFASGPFQYDPSRSVLWSIGSDGRDDGGTALPGLMGQNDIVWRTP